MSALLVDAHVHYHPRFELDRFLKGARSNFRRFAPGGLGEEEPLGALVLTEPAGADVFSGWRNGSIEKETSSWSVQRTEEEASLLLLFQGTPSFFVIAGRQIQTREGVEILAVGSRRRYGDGIPLTQGLAQVRGDGAIAVLPWGFGKWWGRRGDLVGKAVREGDRSTFFLGDNRSRPRGVPTSSLFRLAAESGIGLLSGSDPLPFPSHNSAAGSFGSLVAAPIDRRRPLGALAQALARGPDGPSSYGERTDLMKFCIDQIRLRCGRGGRPA